VAQIYQLDGSTANDSVRTRGCAAVAIYAAACTGRSSSAYEIDSRRSVPSAPTA
jgi:hypothetical protein